MADTLDSEDVEDLLLRLTDAYDFTLTSKVFSETKTIGDIHDAVWDHLPLALKQGGKCATLVAFYRLKQRLAAAYPDIDWRPNTRFASVPAFRYDRVQDGLRGWSLPGRKIESPVWWLAGAGALASSVLFWPYDHVFSLLLALCVFGFGATILHMLVFRRGRCTAATLGAMARYVSAINLGRMKDEGATLNRKMLWRIFEMHLGQSLTRDMRVA